MGQRTPARRFWGPSPSYAILPLPVFPQVFGKYILERELSRGGMARVLLATLRGAGGFEKRLVVKQIREELCSDQQFVSRFVEEAKTTVALSHPNIVPVYELGVEQGTYFLALELVDGVTVHELLRGGEDKKRRLTPEQGAYIGVEVCRALDYAHRRMQVVHRDVTPRNVMLDEEGQVKVIDFGIAAPARVAGHEVFGSPGHMPPEQVDGHELGPATDIFAVAVLLMEAWSGVAPFRRATEAECDTAMRGPHPRPSDVDPRLLPLDEVIGRAMSLDPALRPKDADELGRALRKFMQGIDAADVARDLGAHVRSVRKSLAKKRARAGMPGYEWKPSQPSIVEFSTKTFAVREEVKGWKSEAPLPMGAPEGGAEGPSTRQMPTSGRPPPLADALADAGRDADSQPVAHARADADASDDRLLRRPVLERARVGQGAPRALRRSGHARFRRRPDPRRRPCRRSRARAGDPRRPLHVRGHRRAARRPHHAFAGGKSAASRRLHRRGPDHSRRALTGARGFAGHRGFGAPAGGACI